MNYDASGDFDDFDEGKRDRRDRRRKPKKSSGEPVKKASKRSARDERRAGKHREDPRVLGGASLKVIRTKKQNRVIQDLEKIKAPSNQIRYPDCPTTGKRSYGSPAAAADAIETVRKVKNGDYYPTRAYRCPDCDYWHMTSKNFVPSLFVETVEFADPARNMPANMHDPAELMRQRDHAGDE